MSHGSEMVWQGTAQDMSKPLNIVAIVVWQASCDSGRKDQAPRRRRSFRRCTRPFSRRSAASEAQVATWVSWGLLLNGYCIWRTKNCKLISDLGLESSWFIWWTHSQTFSSSRSCSPPPGTRFIASYHHMMLPPKYVFQSRSVTYSHVLTHFHQIR